MYTHRVKKLKCAPKILNSSFVLVGFKRVIVETHSQQLELHILYFLNCVVSTQMFTLSFSIFFLYLENDLLFFPAVFSHLSNISFPLWDVSAWHPSVIRTLGPGLGY